MILNEDLTERPLISQYTPQAIHLKDDVYAHNILIDPSGHIAAWPIKTLSNITPEDCEQMLLHQPEVILIGTGATHELPDLSLIRFFANHHIGIEIMNTAAACRTYNVLILEARRVLAGLIL